MDRQDQKCKLHDRGVVGTTLDEVKGRASSSQLYHYFDDKPALVRAVIEQQTDTVIGTQEPVLAGIDSIEGLRAWRDVVADLERKYECRGGCPIGSLGSQLAEVDPSSRSQVSASSSVGARPDCNSRDVSVVGDPATR